MTGLTRRMFLGAAAAAGLSPGLVSRPAHAMDEVSLRLHWLINGTSTCWYLGVERGFFRDEGINLKINEGKGSVLAAQVVGSGSEQFGTADGVSIIQTASKGVPVKTVLVLQPVGALGVIYLEESGIRTIKDLEGKRLGVTPGDSLTQQWPLVARANKLDEKSIKLTYMDAGAKPVALMEKRIDAMLGTTVDHVVVVRRRGFKVGSLSFADAGVPTVGVSVVTNESLIRTNPDLIRRFAKASCKTLEAFYADPDASVEAAMRARPDIDRAAMLDQARLIKEMYGKDRIGWADPDTWKRTVEAMRATGALKSDRPAESYYTYDFLPA